MIRFGYTIAYVDNVNDELTFFEKAFGLKRRFFDPSGDYGELDTGARSLLSQTMNWASRTFPQAM